METTLPQSVKYDNSSRQVLLSQMIQAHFRNEFKWSILQYTSSVENLV
jgi:hypothetical protein